MSVGVGGEVVGVFDIAVVNAVCWAGFDCRPGYALAEASSSPAVDVTRDGRYLQIPLPHHHSSQSSPALRSGLAGDHGRCEGRK